MVGQLGLAQTLIPGVVLPVDVLQADRLMLEEGAVDHGIGPRNIGKCLLDMHDESIGVEPLG